MSKRARDSLEGVLGVFDVGIKFADMILEPLDPALLLGNCTGDFPFHGY